MHIQTSIDPCVSERGDEKSDAHRRTIDLFSFIFNLLGGVRWDEDAGTGVIEVGGAWVRVR